MGVLIFFWPKFVELNFNSFEQTSVLDTSSSALENMAYKMFFFEDGRKRVPEHDICVFLLSFYFFKSKSENCL